MESTLKKLKKNEYELTVELGREELDVYVKQAEANISAGFKMDGFRRGKVPHNMIRKEMGDKLILEEAMSVALNDSLAKTLDEQKLEVIKVSGLNVKENSVSKLIYSAVVTVFPPVNVGNVAGLAVKREEITVERKEIEDSIEFLRVSHSKTLAKEGSAEKGDRIEIDFEVTSEGLPIEGGVSKNHPIILGENKFIPGFEERVMGMKQGEEKKFSLSAPKDYFHKDIAGKKLDFNVKVVKVEEVQKPLLTDDFARSIGRFKDINDLEHSVSRGLFEEKKAKESQRIRFEILSKILEKSKVEVPEEMIDERLKEMITGFDNDLHMKGMELSIYLTHLGKTEDDLKKDWRGEASRQVALALLLKKIAKDNNIRPELQEIEEATERLVQGMAMKGELDKDNLDLERIREVVTSDLLNEKVFSYLERNHAI
ncbi:MAG: trigger factor [Candidatus Taylorbacteria bacterium]|nr:trigger factor [Candidatus Taylorbacteria bacterium]